MSSNEEEDYDTNHQNAKKRRIQRACDICRRKKIRCDGGQMPGNRCSNCIAYSFECTYVEAAKRRGPPKGYVESLENRLEKMQNLLHRLMPDADFSNELGGSFDRDTWTFDNKSSFRPSKPNCAGRDSPLDIATSLIRGYTNDTADRATLEREDETAHLALVDNFKHMAIGTNDYRFFGKSSGAMLVKAAIDLKHEVSGKPLDDPPTHIVSLRRPEFWTSRAWEKSVTEPPPPIYTFPDDDLIWSLTALYFDQVNVYLPLLHRPIFERSIRNGLHYENHVFGAVLLLVCAVGSRWSDDPRVFLESGEPHSCGWKWFDQVQLVRRSLLQPPTLYDLQFYCLSVQYLQGTSAPQACWTMIGIGIRIAQDVGAHRRKVGNRPLTPEDELWKRGFWVLVCLDRMISSVMGRPCAIQDEDFDLDPPIDCDDEYWEHPDPALAFKQPPGKPSRVSSFMLLINLMQLLAFTLQTIYSINKSKILLGFVGTQWEQHIVAELDSALNKWVDSVPDHLRWDPKREDLTFFNQSVLIYCCYYHLQILVHRPFIPSPKKPSPLSFPSLAICTNAARSCSHLVDIQRRRVGKAMPYHEAIFSAGIVLLLNIWGGKRSGLSTDPAKEMADVHKCMQALKQYEDRWHSAGRLWDILAELACVGDLPLPTASPAPTNKRERDAESPKNSSSTTPLSQDTPPSEGVTRSIASNRRVANINYLPPALPSAGLFSLPMYSDELGRLPLHGNVSFSSQAPATSTPPEFWFSSSDTVHAMGRAVHEQATHPSLAAGGYVPIQDGDSSGYDDQHGGMVPAGYGSYGYAPMPSGSNQQMSDNVSDGVMHSDTMAMWSSAPSGFELDEWNAYLSEMTQTIQDPGGGAVQ